MTRLVQSRKWRWVKQEITFKRDALGRETRREVGGFRLAQRYNEAGQLTAQTAGPKSPVDIGISRLGWHVPSGEGTPRRSGTVNRIYEYDRAFAPVRVDDGLWGDVRLDYDDNGQIVADGGARGYRTLQLRCSAQSRGCIVLSAVLHRKRRLRASVRRDVRDSHSVGKTFALAAHIRWRRANRAWSER